MEQCSSEARAICGASSIPEGRPSPSQVANAMLLQVQKLAADKRGLESRWALYRDRTLLEKVRNMAGRWHSHGKEAKAAASSR